MKSIILATAAILAIAPAALAAPGGNGNGNGGSGHAAANLGVGRDASRSLGSAGVNGGWSVNSGVATNPGGHVMPRVPPGQAMQLSRQSGGLAVGAVLSSNYPGYRTLNGSRYNLPAAPAGYEYVRVGDNAYLRNSNTGVVASIVRNPFR
ncbi:MAG TPA: RcnB family protein [Caulobacteraceae bacterium]|jgi:hypothetical protein|nr:RcnB family protein [Caulobacteraceae bacterium]